MNTRERLLLLGSGFVLFLAVSCFSAGGGNDDCEQGDEGCACFPNGTCNAGLACSDDKCVDPRSTGSGGTSGIDKEACVACADASCAAAADECEATVGCEALVECLLDCANQ